MILPRGALSPATASIAMKTANPNGRPKPQQKIREATETTTTIDEMRGGTRNATKTMRRHHQKVGFHTPLAHDVPLTATQRVDHAHTDGDHTPHLSQTPMYHRQDHRDEATHNVRGAVTATHTIRTMSTHAETIAGATTAAT
jgi:hypothetical protein